MRTFVVLRAARLGASVSFALLAACGQRASFYDSRSAVTATTGTGSASSDATAVVPAGTDTDVSVATTTTGSDSKTDKTGPDGGTIREVEHSLTEALALGTTQAIAEPPVALPAEPLETYQCPAQVISPTTGAPVPAAVSGAVASLRTQSFTKIAPMEKYSPADALAAAGKPVDVYLIIDNTEGLLDFAPLQQRALDSVTNLLTQIYQTDWRLYVGGIVAGGGSSQLSVSFLKTAPGGGTTYALSDLSTTIPQAIVAGIYRNVANDDAELFRSLNQLHGTYGARANATVANFIVSNAANCKVTQVSNGGNTTLWSRNCNATAGNPDYFDYLVSSNGGAASSRNAANLFGALYQMNANPTVCGSFHVPENDASFTGGSQYAALAAHLETINYPELTPLSPASWVGDLCADTVDWSFLDRFGGAILDEATHRFLVSDASNIYDLSSFGYPNQVVLLSGGQPGAALAGSQLQTVGAPVYPGTVKNMLVRVTDASLDGQSVEARYFQDNGFRSASFALTYTPDPNAPVTVSWAPGGTLSCAAASGANPSFTSGGPQCQYFGTTLYLASMAVLPAVSPGATLPFMVSYTNLVQVITSLTLNAASSLLGAPYDQVTLLVSANGQAAQPVTNAIVSNPGGSPTQRLFTLPGNAAFPAGTYSAVYFEQNDTNSTCTLPASAKVAAGTPAILCYLPAGRVDLNPASGALEMSAGTAYSCTLSGQQLAYGGVLTPHPTDATSNFLTVAYKATVAPQSQFNLQKVPDDGSLVLKISAANAPTVVLTSSQYTLNGKVLTLATALEPGETLAVTYTVTVPLSVVNCLQLSAVAVDGKYTVTYGPTGAPAPLDAAKYALTFPAGNDKPGLLCLASGVADFNHTLIVAYTDEDVTTSSAN